MTGQEKDLCYEVLDVLAEAIKAKPPGVDFPVRIDNHPRPPGMSLSSAGKGTRLLAHMQVGSQKKEGQPRYLLNMDMGTLAHDYLRWIINEYEDAAVVDAERTTEFFVMTDHPKIPGHIDGFVEYTVQGGFKKRILIDIKCVNLYTFNDLDPRNPETNWWARARKWAAGNYVFDAIEAFSSDDFKAPYLDQILTYEKGLADEGEEWDATVFILYCRDTSHVAVGIFNPTEEQREQGINRVREKMAKVLDMPDPLEYDTCWEAAVGSAPYVVCQYCDYLHECFDIKTKVFRGKPRMNILRIK